MWNLVRLSLVVVKLYRMCAGRQQPRHQIREHAAGWQPAATDKGWLCLDIALRWLKASLPFKCAASLIWIELVPGYGRTVTSAAAFNIMQLADFGFSKDANQHSAPTSRVGTPAYLAPEVISNQPGQVYDGQVRAACLLCTALEIWLAALNLR
jgi:serine/threonine protein kinase